MNRKTIATAAVSFAKAFCLAGLLSVPIYSSASTVSFEVVNGMYILKAQDSTVKQVFDYIEKHSKYVFVYDQPVKDRLEYKVNIELQGKSINAILAEVCRLADLNYHIQNRQVTITANSPKKATTQVKKVKHISGQIVDVTELPLIGATVRVKGSDAATITDLDGKFKIDVPEGSELLISYVGYVDQTVRIDSRSMYAIVMEEASKALNEVVVIGYGAVKKKDLTGAVASIKGDDLVAKKTTTLSTALQGSVSGLMVRRDNNAPGASASSIHVRGVTTIGESAPLIIVDGVQCDNIDYVNSNDVESISVLKDAAAASIYGSRAAAGVILITTKRGSTSDLNLTYTGEYGWSIPTRQPEMVGVTRYLEMNNELLYNDNPSAGFFSFTRPIR